MMDYGNFYIQMLWSPLLIAVIKPCPKLYITLRSGGIDIL